MAAGYGRHWSEPPPPPKRVPDALESLRVYQEWESKGSRGELPSYSLRADTEADAYTISSEILSAKRWLNSWAGYDVRVRPKVLEYYVLGGVEVEAGKLSGVPSAYAAHYWRCHFVVHPPKERGLRVASDDAKARSQEAAQRAKAQMGLRGPVPKPRRTVQIRREEEELRADVPPA
jgi:hypothetical protein